MICLVICWDTSVFCTLLLIVFLLLLLTKQSEQSVLVILPVSSIYLIIMWQGSFEVNSSFLIGSFVVKILP